MFFVVKNYHYQIMENLVVLGCLTMSFQLQRLCNIDWNKNMIINGTQ
jgi:hypothetical protein